MGWTDREPYFSMIENRADAIVEAEGLPRAKAWELALEDVTERVRESMDDRRGK